MKKPNEKIYAKKSERGQAIILIAFAFIGLVAIVGLVADTGILLIEYGKLKRSVDAAAVAAAQEFRPDPNTGVLNVSAMENAARSFLQVNQMNNVRDIIIHTCENSGADRPSLCNPDPINNPIENRKLVEVTAVADITFSFLRVLGINGTELRISSIGEAATIDLVLLIDTSGSMAYETSGNPTRPDPGDDPRVCNTNDNCQPMRAVKDVALEFVDSLIYFGYDRVSVIAMTGQAANSSSAVARDPVEVLPLSFDRDAILYSIDTLKVFQPRICDGTDTPGECLQYLSGTFNRPICETFQIRIGNPDPGVQATADPSSCPSSNIGGMLNLARNAYSGSGNPANQRTESLWVTVLLASGPANASTPSSADLADYPNGYCPQNTWLYFLMPDPKPLWCRDAYPGVYHDASDPLVSYTNPINDVTIDISLYDAEDYARDQADNLAAMKSGSGVTIYTIGLGANVKTLASGQPSGSTDGEAELLLQYIAREAGNLLNPDINHGEYFYAPNNVTLRNIFEIIAQNIATKISQ
ncbi:MAG: hypothetical protein DPW18_08490 [Chloroflexi bacterium]|nr:hypothetical protein [Chloroflexota bacterium]MDL1941812.1 VWA domain-containing protein [Chloroflexi bacterium CFX2]